MMDRERPRRRMSPIKLVNDRWGTTGATLWMRQESEPSSAGSARKGWRKRCADRSCHRADCRRRARSARSKDFSAVEAANAAASGTASSSCGNDIVQSAIVQRATERRWRNFSRRVAICKGNHHLGGRVRADRGAGCGYEDWRAGTGGSTLAACSTNSHRSGQARGDRARVKRSPVVPEAAKIDAPRQPLDGMR